MSTEPDPAYGTESLDGNGAGDHDQIYVFGRPSTIAPFPFSTRQFARLLILKSRIEGCEEFRSGQVEDADFMPW